MDRTKAEVMSESECIQQGLYKIICSIIQPVSLFMGIMLVFKIYDIMK